MVEGHVPQGVRVQLPPSALRSPPNPGGGFFSTKSRPGGICPGGAQTYQYTEARKNAEDAEKAFGINRKNVRWIPFPPIPGSVSSDLLRAFRGKNERQARQFMDTI
jgi:hypothetical protein